MAITGRTLQLEQELRDELAKITDRHTRDLVRAWATAWDEVAPDLTAALDDMLKSGSAVTKTQMLRSARLRKSLAVIATQLETLVKDAGITVTGSLRELIDTAGQTQARMVASQLPPRTDLVDLDSWSRVDGRQIDAIVRRSTEQITAATRPLSTQAYAAVRRELIRGVAAGSNPRETAREMVRRAEGKFNGGLTRALTIARTETLDAHRAGAALGQAQHTDVLQGWEWLADLGPRTCPACWGMNGTFHTLDEPGPNGHQNCRCARLPVTKPWSDLGLQIDEPPPLFPDADAQFLAMAKADQVQVLGPKGYAAWKAGKFPRSSWAVRQKNPGWRDSFVPARPPKVAAPKPTSNPKESPRPSQPPHPLSQIPRINPQLIANMEKRDVDVAEWNRRATNPKYGTDPAFGVNCQRVVHAYELRSRGYDVTAKANPADGSDLAAVFLKWTNGAEKRMVDSGRYVVSQNTKNLVASQDRALAAQMVTDAEAYVRGVVESWPVGARGWVMFYRSGSAGHIFNIDRTAAGAVVREAQVPDAAGLRLSRYMGQVRSERPRNGRLNLRGPGVFVARVDDLDFTDGVLEAIEWTR